MTKKRILRFVVAAMATALVLGTFSDQAQAQTCPDELLIAHDLIIPAGTVSSPGVVQISLSAAPSEVRAVDILLKVPFKAGLPSEGGFYDHQDLKLPWVATIVEPAPASFEVKIQSLAPFAVSGVTVIVKQICECCMP